MRQIVLSWDCAGLSPRMRGNPFLVELEDRFGGSIPAHAGEPLQSAEVNHDERVYPRACGGTHRDERIVVEREGLSPRMRGNRQHRA